LALRLAARRLAWAKVASGRGCNYFVILLALEMNGLAFG
jgi:hypothetical protein